MKKSFMTRVLAVTLSAAMAFSLSSATSLTAPEAATKKLAANKKAVSISLKVGKSTTLKLKNYKKWNITKAKTNKKAVATVKNAGTKAKRTVKVTAQKKGTAKVTLTLGKRKVANSKSTKYTKTITKKVTVKVTKATTTDTTPTDTTPIDTTPTDTTPTEVTPGVLNIAQVTATKVDTLVVSFSSVVASTSAVNLTVTKGTAKVDTKSVTWNTEGTAATIETVAKMTKGTYTVTATDGTQTTTGTVEIVDQTVKEIKFLNETALTGKNGNTTGYYAYVYYDVLDQYGESMRDTVSIQWSGSATLQKQDRSKGRLTFRKSNNETFTFGDKLYVTGVYTKTGVSNSATFTIGTEQNVDTIKFVGFVKKSGTEILDKLPADFKKHEYQLLYTPFDQNGCEIDAADYVKESDLTFISDNVLVVKEVVDNNGNTVTVSGTEYCAGNVVPGINVTAGGSVNLSAISTRTGVKSTLNFVVGAYRTLKKFEIESPSDYVIDGESIVIPFVAEDVDGNKMTNFKELANQSDFSKLTFNESDGCLYLDEADDGSARLVWEDVNANTGAATEAGQWNPNSTDDIDRPISLTAIVVGGETSNQMIYVQDRARPEAIAKVGLDKAMIYLSSQKLSLSNFEFLDQYGRNMTNTYKTKREQGFKYEYDGISDFDVATNSAATRAYTDGTINNGYVYDNGFFAYANANGDASTSLRGTDFANYTHFGVSVVMTSNDAGKFIDAGTITTKKLGGNDVIAQSGHKSAINNNCYGYIEDGTLTGYVVSSAAVTAEPSLKFTIQKYNTNDKDYEEISKSLTETVKITTLNQLSSFALDDIDKIAITTPYSSDDTGANLKTDYPSDGTLDTTLGSETKKAVVTSRDLKLKAVYSGNSVEIPTDYYLVTGGGILVPASSTLGDHTLAYFDQTQIKYKDLYDNKSAQFVRKDASDTVEVVVYAPDTNGSFENATQHTNAKKVALISDATPEVSTFTSSDTVTLAPSATFITLGSLNSVGYDDYSTTPMVLKELADAASNDELVVKDQYGTTVYKVDAWNQSVEEKYQSNRNYVVFEYLVKDVKEATGYINGNFKVSSNGTQQVSITGAEPGDTFTLEITAKCNNGSPIGASTVKSVKVTVGGDDWNVIHGSTNGYTMDGGVRAILQAQLVELLGNTTSAKNN